MVQHDKCHFKTGLQLNSLPHYKSAPKSKLCKLAVFESETFDLAGANFKTGAIKWALGQILLNYKQLPHWLFSYSSSTTIMVRRTRALDDDDEFESPVKKSLKVTEAGKSFL
jgi:hypothetical protein